MTPSDAETATTTWIHRVVIGENLCPFARASLPGLLVKGLRTRQPEAILSRVIDEATGLLRLPLESPHTTVLVLEDGFTDFEQYLDLLATAEHLLDAVGFSGKIQLASFHPDYCFEGVPASDPANFTNRSPYPCLHLLREADVTWATSRHPDPTSIPERNIEHLRQMSREVLEQLFRP